MDSQVKEVIRSRLSSILGRMERMGSVPGSDELSTTIAELEHLCSAANMLAETIEAFESVLSLVQRALCHLRAIEEDTSRQNVSYQVPTSKSNAVGRPRYDISREMLAYLLEYSFSIPAISNMLGLSVSTTKRRLREFDLSASGTYSDMDDDELDLTVNQIKEDTQI
eukprot:m.171680 g.171680  ORF g.171680 m.171680 type:complete len:167 (+) comp39068_c0_seq2:36-536(+)